MAKKYIDADKLIGEIRKLRSENCTSELEDYYEYAKTDIIDIINTLQQEQPDTEKLKREWWNKGYFEGRKNAHIPAKELGLPKAWDFRQEQSCDTCTNDKGCVTCKDGELWEGKEQPSEDLEKAAEEYRRKTCNEACKNGFLDNHPSPSIKTAFKAGAEWQKEQMLKDAVDGVLIDILGLHIQAPLNSIIHKLGLKDGDKVKIVFVKEDKKCFG